MSVKLKWGGKGESQASNGGNGPPGPLLGTVTKLNLTNVSKINENNKQSI